MVEGLDAVALELWAHFPSPFSAAAYTDLGESYLKAGKRAEAKKQILGALEIAPGYERAQGLLLKLVEK